MSKQFVRFMNGSYIELLEGDTKMGQKTQTTRVVRDKNGDIVETVTTTSEGEETPKKSTTTEIIVLLDRSGSMADIKKDIELGFDSFVGEQREGKGRANLTLVQFDTQGVETVYEGTPMQHVPKLILSPRGGTPLLDAIGDTIASTKHRLLKQRRKIDKVVFVIVTDGQENQSRKFSKSQVNALINEAKSDLDWQFVYLGANQDAIREGAGMGVANSHNYIASPIHTSRMWKGASEVIGNYRSSNVMYMMGTSQAAMMSASAPGYFGDAQGKDV